MPDETSDGFREFLKSLEDAEAKLQIETAPGVVAYGSVRPMGRIRAYTSAGLAPFAGRGAQSEFHLLGHIHYSTDGLVQRVEGFNGPEGERWAKSASDKLRAAGKLAPGAKVTPATPLRGCPHTGIR